VKNKHVFAAVLITYLVMSFMPQLGLGSMMGKKKRKG
jgi:hypothetical protein